MLLYHGFSNGRREDDAYHLSVPTEALEAQLTHLRERSWRALDLDDYLACVNGSAAGTRTYLVTIDDALRSVLTTGAPILERAGVPSVLFAPPALIGATTGWLELQADDPLLTVDELRAVAAFGVEVGVHGWDHQSMVGMDDAALRRSTVEARDAVADLTGARPRAFAYPYGDFDARARRAVAAAGFEIAFSVYSDAGRFAVSRTDVKPDDSLAAFRVKLAAGSRYRLVWRAAGVVKPVRRLLRRSAQSR